jgi:hypothetical protein
LKYYCTGVISAVLAERSQIVLVSKSTHRNRAVRNAFLTALARRHLIGSFSRLQSNARMPKPVSLGSPSRSSTKPKFISTVRSLALTGENFVRLLRMSRITHRRWIAVFKSSSASSDFACRARDTTLSVSAGGATAMAFAVGATFRWPIGGRQARWLPF